MSERPTTDVTVGGADAPAGAPDRFVDPGHPPHRERMSDRDPRAAKRAELQVVTILGLSLLGSLGAVVAYVLVPSDGTVEGVRTSTLLLGLGIFFAMAGIGVAAVHWAKSLMNDREQFEDRHPQRSDDATRAAAVEKLREGAADANIGRRTMLKGAVVSAVALAPLGIAVPLVGEVGGDWNVGKFRHTVWERGRRLARDPSGTPIKASEVTIGSVFHVIPEGMREEEHWIEEKAKAVVLMVRLDPRDLTESEDRKSWSYEGIVAYSKICTHVGCPVALYEQQTHHLLCPCHQSTFDISDGAKVVFGPAKRALPQLPITVDEEGYLVAQDDFAEPIGPSYWERLR